jgi:hypothetical protein
MDGYSAGSIAAVALPFRKCAIYRSWVHHSCRYNENYRLSSLSLRTISENHVSVILVMLQKITVCRLVCEDMRRTVQ